MKKLKDSKNLKVPKSSLKLQEGCCLRKKIHSSKETFKKKFKWESQKFKENFKRNISSFENPREISKWMGLNDEFLK